jgi:GGDEF domain-containing protein
VLVAVEPESTLRHPDRIVAEVARRLRTQKREGDLLARIDAAVFALAAPSTGDRPQLEGLAQRIAAALREPALSAGGVGIRIGAAGSPQDADDLPGLVAAADAALSYARHQNSGIVLHRDAA